MWRVSLVGALWCTAACDAERACHFDDVVADYIAQHDVLDCGDLPPSLEQPSDVTPWRAAHDCVIAASSAEQPFVVRWTVQGTEGQVELAYVGLAREGTWTLAAFERSFRDDGSRQPVERYDCSSLFDLGSCANVDSTLCLTCVNHRLVDDCP